MIADICDTTNILKSTFDTDSDHVKYRGAYIAE